ncbi:MAG: hypothetical protein ACSHW0_01790 [Thalassotalea sp.]
MTRKTTRIEPTLSGTNNHADEPLIAQAAHTQQTHRQATRQKTSQRDTFTQVFNKLKEVADIAITFVREKILPNRKLTLSLAGLFIAIIIITLLLSIFSGDGKNEEIIEPELNEADITATINLSNRSHQITLPDNFSLLATDYNGIVINWQAESNSENKIWDIHTTEGDAKCQAIKFNNGDSYRTLNVLVENNKSYFANFSPLDSAAIVKAIALRGNFTLCGYQFSLKGSQAVLGKHPYYSDLLSYE